MKEINNKIFNKDSRDILKYIPSNEIITTTITSPPYFDMKDYGHKNQIGFGQSYKEYLADLKKVFSNVFQITKEEGSLWVIIDTFKKDSQVVPLPFDLSSELTDIGWKLQDIIIWKKDKTVPWSGKGFMQRKFEYILFFSKSKKFKYNKDKTRVYDTSLLKKWWVKYPERYNPKGKALDEVWEYPIPTQGSWGDKYIKHFCPLPVDMVGTMIQLSTDENDLILDPFAGSGSVLAQSVFMKRAYIGFELNKEYIKMFEKYLSENIDIGLKNYLRNNKNNNQNKFQKTILELRSLKFARVLYNTLVKNGIDNDFYIEVEQLGGSIEKNKLIKVRYSLIGSNDKKLIGKILNEALSKAPLTKFGIEPEICFKDLSKLNSSSLYGYTSTNTHSYYKKINNKIDNKCKIVSTIKMELDENDYE